MGLSEADDIVSSGVRSLRIGLGTNFIWIGVNESTDREIKIADVLFGSSNFYANQRESFF